MRKITIILILGFLLGAVPSVQAQKWRGIKNIFSSSKAKISVFSLRSKVEEAVLRAVTKKKNPPYFAQVIVGEKIYNYASLAALLPPVEEVSGKSKIPPFPLPENEKEIYRGMVLDADGKDLLYILRHGLEVSKSHYENFAAYDGKNYPDGTKAIYAAREPNQTFYYLTDEKQPKPYLPVILHLKSVGWRFIVSIPHDVPPSWIYRVSALLKIQGRLTWGELKIQENAFVFYPYLTQESAKK